MTWCIHVKYLFLLCNIFICKLLRLFSKTARLSEELQCILGLPSMSTWLTSHTTIQSQITTYLHLPQSIQRCYKTNILWCQILCKSWEGNGIYDICSIYKKKKKKKKKGRSKKCASEFLFVKYVNKHRKVAKKYLYKCYIKYNNSMCTNLRSKSVHCTIYNKEEYVNMSIIINSVVY